MNGSDLVKVTNSLMKILIESGYTKDEACKVLIASGELMEELKNGRKQETSDEIGKERSSRL